MPTFEVKTPVGANQLVMKKQIREAIAEATRRGKLRPNSVDSITGENSATTSDPGRRSFTSSSGRTTTRSRSS
jgi:fumarate hydratase class I